MHTVDEAEFNRWIRSAELTLASARRDLAGGDYNWACFKAHQVAEKAVKALLWGLGHPRTGHSLVELGNAFSSLGLDIPKEVYEAFAKLSMFYIPTRYPDVWTEGIPEEYYTESEARSAVELAEKVLAWVLDTWRRLLGRD